MPNKLLVSLKVLFSCIFFFLSQIVALNKREKKNALELNNLASNKCTIIPFFYQNPTITPQLQCVYVYFSSTQSIRREFILTVDLLKFISNKEILSDVKQLRVTQSVTRTQIHVYIILSNLTPSPSKQPPLDLAT